MSLRITVITVGIVALFGLLFAPRGPLGASVWPEPAHAAEPVGMQLPLFVVLGLFEAVAMGLGVAFLLFGWRYTKRVFAATPRLAPPAHVSVAWLLGSWWVHDNLHMVLGSENLSTLLALEYGFHVTLMIAGGILAASVYALARDAGRSRPEARAGSGDSGLESISD
ncbi:hypothetical protein CHINAEXTREME_07595 [Halobiforma lacisalsi AJ5]|uniref:Amino acid adenylation domain-containing protein n=1 Tax=Natronobacterium lacisalsi AJ5 TaxID=358396 RepID=M0LXA6_NATLA|nr:hypothetical protein [Halobiforma lacisalsi]APW97643.1 hypothetical protein CHINAEXTREME_07595 [Halobiforma lacisalsi AJ5]EMA36969.1 amino acid adenylation domain-containing protein [Halobiforma lacisalsi AJ5]